MVRDKINKFKAELLNQPFDAVVQKYIFTGTPFVFRDSPARLSLLKSHLARGLGVREDNVTIVGSAQTGFSLNPDSFPRVFHHGSDIDVLVVDERLFDKVWYALLRWHYPRKGYPLPRPDASWRSKRRNELYWGWFVPSKIRFEGLTRPTVLGPLRNIATMWFNAFKSLAQYQEFVTRDVSGRLYRSWDHAMLYHMNGLRAIWRRLVD